MPSRDDLAYLNVHTVEDSVTYGRLRLRNIPVTHNKSPTRWRNVRPPLTVLCEMFPDKSFAGYPGKLSWKST